MTDLCVPPYLSPGQIAKACGVTRKIALAELRRADVTELRGGRWRVSESRLRERLPDYYDRVYRFFVLGKPTPRNDVGKLSRTGPS